MPHPTRPAPLNAADAGFAARLEGLLPPGTISAPGPRYLEEPRGRWRGTGEVLARPRNTAEVATVVRACAEARVGIVPFGGGTGLVGGQVMETGPAPLILSLERMAAVRAVFPAENVLVVEAGATLAEVQEAALAAGRMFPLTLASQGSARIGGNLATNAGGVNVLRYGNIRDLCLGVEAVLPDGSVLNGLKRLRKDNSGYDLRHLLIGSEGTLGVITAAALRMVPRPAGIGTAMLVVESPAAALELLALAEERLAGCVSAFELISKQGLLFLDEVMPEVRQPFAGRPEWMVLIELGLPRGLDPQEALEELFVAASEAGLVSDGVIAQSAGQQAELWRLRESLPDANRKIGAVSSHDISVPLSEIPGFISAAEAALAGIGSFRINCFGHVGDGNLHFNVFPMPGHARAEHDNQREAIKTCVHDIADGLGGSVSAEHGVGRLKTSDMERYGDPAKLAVLRAIKAAIDPLGIMNPGALLAERA
ncbi:FAD-binding oxidoreductase [Frigidibacter sp.]|uniref:FAD-binding oxidoreductase n=1 Tax=Frigidibacter sp. TaxID=2586418 RepID=UPI002736A536|nr:FAD-binding oxidoreductase [Frigidibacter sp.]MDP3338785.1 FAD-binding oxidoreductase [Frigidibacter sp.]